MKNLTHNQRKELDKQRSFIVGESVKSSLFEGDPVGVVVEIVEHRNRKPYVVMFDGGRLGYYHNSQLKKS